MRVGLARIDGHRLAKSLRRLGVIAALLINESELILRLAIVRIQRRRIQHAPEVLTAAQTRAQVADLSAQIVVRVEQKEWRRQPSQQKPQRPPQECRA